MHELLKRCDERHIVLNDSEKKFILKQRSLPYMGHIFSAKGLSPDPQKIRAITDMPTPSDKAALRRFLGMANYLSRFVPHLSDLCQPLRQVVNTEEDWHWSLESADAFEKTKLSIANAMATKYFNRDLTTVVQCDASSTGLGAALLQKGHPVAFASRALSKCEQNYCQLEKELLAIVFGMHHFDQYVYGRHVWIESDHKPLEILLKKPLKDSPRRIQRMMLELQRYDIRVEYKKGVRMFVADPLSRAFLSNTKCEFDTDERVCQFTTQEELSDIDPVKEVPAVSDQRLIQVAEHTANDEGLRKLIEVIHAG